MLKRLSVGLILWSLLLSLPIGAVAATATLSLGGWQVSGSQRWRISFPGAYNPSTGKGASELYYPQSGDYITANYEQPLSPKRELSIEAGVLSAIQPATGTDSDWDYSRNHDLWYFGEFTTSGSSNFFNIDLKQATGPNTEFFYGYGYSHSHYIMTEGLYHTMDYNQVNQYLSDLNSTYSLTYHGPHAGITGTKELSPKLALIGSLSYAPLVLVQGHGWWNLRALDFKHIGSGQMLDGKIGLRYNVTGRRNNALTIGYRYQQFSLFTGSENTSSDITWTKAVKVQQGIYFGSDFRF